MQIKVTEIEEHEDGSATIHLEASDKFIAWFKATQGLKRWSPRRFEKWARKALQEGLTRLENEDESDPGVQSP